MKPAEHIQTRTAGKKTRPGGKTLVWLTLVTLTVLAGCSSGSRSTSVAKSAATTTTGTSGSQSQSVSASTTPTSTSTSPKHTSRRSEPAPATTIGVSIPVLLPENYIPKRYTCEGADVSLPVQWSDVPPGTAELAMFVVNLRPVDGRFFFDWAVAGLNPTSHGTSAGRLPPGAVVGRNGFGNVGYSICPAKGTGEEHYVLRVVALPHPLAVKPGFNAETLYQEAERSAKVVGLAGGAYTPPQA